MKSLKPVLLGFVLAGVTSMAAAQNEQFIPMLSYRVGPYAAGGSGIFGGYIDYLNLINLRDGGINGVKLTWEECETEYNNARGVECYERLKNKGTGATLVMPLSTGITYALIEKATADKIPLVTIGYGRTDASDGRVFPYVFPLITNYWSQNTAKIKFIGMKEGGMDKLKGKKIVNLYHDSAYGKETIPILDAQAKKYGFEVTHIPVPLPGNEQGAQWLRDSQDQARLGHPARLRRDESGRAQGRGQGRLPTRPHRRRLVEWRGGRHHSGRRRCEGLHRGGLQRRRGELPGGPGDREGRLRQEQGQHGGQDAHRVDLLQPRRGIRHRHHRGDPHRPGEIRQGQGHDRASRFAGPSKTSRSATRG